MPSRQELPSARRAETKSTNATTIRPTPTVLAGTASMRGMPKSQGNGRDWRGSETATTARAQRLTPTKRLSSIPVSWHFSSWGSAAQSRGFRTCEELFHDSWGRRSMPKVRSKTTPISPFHSAPRFRALTSWACNVFSRHITYLLFDGLSRRSVFQLLCLR